MFDFSIVQSDTRCLSKFSSNTYDELIFLQFLDSLSEETILKSIELDSVEYGIYRVWRDSRLLGKFYRDTASGLWISQPCDYKLVPRFETSDDAAIFIVEMNALTAA